MLSFTKPMTVKDLELQLSASITRSREKPRRKVCMKLSNITHTALADVAAWVSQEDHALEGFICLNTW